MGLLSVIGKIVLVIINIVFLLIGLALLAVGVVLRFFGDKIASLLGNMDLNAATQDQFSIPSFDKINEIPFISDIGVALIVIGVVLVAISFCACCGACYEFKVLLIIFIIAMSILVIVQGVVIGLFLTKDSAIHTTIKDQLSTQIKEEYKNDNDEDIFSGTINLVHYLLQCCGMQGQSDFNTVPKSCCKKENIEGSSAQQLLCDDPTTNPLVFNTEGCYDNLQDKFLEFKTQSLIVLIIVLGAQVAEIIFAILIIKSSSIVSPI